MTTLAEFAVGVALGATCRLRAIRFWMEVGDFARREEEGARGGLGSDEGEGKSPRSFFVACHWIHCKPFVQQDLGAIRLAILPINNAFSHLISATLT